MAKKPVYCVHIWTSHGTGVSRCEICKILWYEYKDRKPPQRVIGFVDLEDTGAMPEFDLEA